ncbi:MAG TPA: gfo/Idh/MocA family oxidoreductase, partial [Ramlibacter sp.]|nr:gfo/Idh/MocA family oxidoreductase [Ramlibacter sp.]
MTETINVIVEGATGRLGGNQHLRALLDIRREGGLPLRNGARLVPQPLLLGRNPAKLAALAAAHGL